jgi:hypothetical protein
MHTSILARPEHISRRQEAHHRVIAVPVWKASIAQQGRPIVIRCARPGTGVLLAQERGMSIRAPWEHLVARLRAS